MQVDALVAELQRQKENKLDVVIDSRLLSAEPVEGNGEVVLKVPMPDGVEQKLRLTEFAHTQLAQKTGIPKKYYDRLRESCKGQLLADNVNAWIHDKERRLVRVLDGKVRAILSDRYRVMDNHDLVFASMEEFQKVNADIHKVALSETYMYVKAILPHLEQEVRQNDSVIPGVVIRNSEVGAGKLAVEPYCVRKVCSNGMIGEATVQRVHLGSKMDLGEVLSDETMELESQTLFSTVKDIIKATFDPAQFKKWVDKMRSATGEEIENPVEAVHVVARDNNMDDLKREELMKRFSTGKDYTVWGMANAITNMARDEADPDKQVELETLGGSILNKTAKDLAKQVA